MRSPVPRATGGSARSRSDRSITPATASRRLRETIACDLVCVSGGWSPTVHLHRNRAPGPATTRARHLLAGRAGPGGALGRRLPMAPSASGPASRRVRAPAPPPPKPPVSRPHCPSCRAFEEPEEAPARLVWQVPSGRPAARDKAFVDLQNDVTAADLALALREGYRSIEHVKRYTTTGMGTDQGKTGNINALGIIAQITGQPIAELGVTTFRPPYTPVSFGAIVGRNCRRAVRAGPAHADPSLARGARGRVRDRRPVAAALVLPARRRGHGRRGRARGRGGADQASASSTPHARQDRPPGARCGELLNRVYTNAWSKLAIGRCRYGLMLGEDGMVFDDGVTARLGEHHYLMSTTTGGAARVLAWLEEWLQTEWPELRVFCTSVTEQWATVAALRPQRAHALAELVARPRRRPRGLPAHERPRGRGAGRAGAGLPHQLHRRARLRDPDPGELWSGAVAGAAWRPAPATASRPTAPRRCTCCAPRRATSSPAKRPTARSRRTTSAWPGSSASRSRISSASARSRAPTSGEPGRKQLVGLLPDDPAACSRRAPSSSPIPARRCR